MLTGDQVRQACELLKWNRYDVQRHTALPLPVVDSMMTSKDAIDVTRAMEIIVQDALHQAGVQFTADGVRLRKVQP